MESPKNSSVNTTGGYKEERALTAKLEKLERESKEVRAHALELEDAESICSSIEAWVLTTENELSLLRAQIEFTAKLVIDH
jgi:hypothetical protein